MDFIKNFKNIPISYYLIGLIGFVFGYSIFALVYFISDKMYFSLILQYISVFFFKYFTYNKYLFSKMSLIKYFFTFLLLIFLNSFFLYIVHLNMQNTYILQFAYMLFIVPFGFFLLTYLNK